MWKKEGGASERKVFRSEADEQREVKFAGTGTLEIVFKAKRSWRERK